MSLIGNNIQLVTLNAWVTITGKDALMEKKCECRMYSAVGLLLVFAAVSTVFMISCAKEGVEMDPAIQKILAYRFGDSREGLSVVEDLVKASYGKPEERLLLEKQFAQVLRSDEATLMCKDFICRQLWLIGTKESVPTLAEMLTVAETSDMARYSLENNTCPEAGETFRNALGMAKGNMLIGIINSLGERLDAMSADAIGKLLSVPDEDVATAAAVALGKIGGVTSRSSLEQAIKSGTPTVRTAASWALLKLADNLLTRGEKVEAAEIFQSLSSIDDPKQLKKAALLGFEKSK